jgi:hypothetical protein
MRETKEMTAPEVQDFEPRLPFALKAVASAAGCAVWLAAAYVAFGRVGGVVAAAILAAVAADAQLFAARQHKERSKHVETFLTASGLLLLVGGTAFWVVAAYVIFGLVGGVVAALLVAGAVAESFRDPVVTNSL